MAENRVINLQTVPAIYNMRNKRTGQIITVINKSRDPNFTLEDAKRLGGEFQKTPQGQQFQAPEGIDVFQTGKPAAGIEKFNRELALRMRQAKKDAKEFLKTPNGKAVGRALFGSEKFANLMVDIAPLPESASDIATDLAFTGAAAIPGAGVIPTAARIVGPSGIQFLTSLAERRSVPEATSRAQMTALVSFLPEAGRAVSGVGRRVKGGEFLQQADLAQVRATAQGILPQGFREIPTTAAGFNKFVNQTLPRLATNRFQGRLQQLRDVGGNLKISVPTVSDNPIAFSDAVDVVSGKAFKLNQRLLATRTGPQKLTLVERNQILDEIEEGLRQFSLDPRKNAVQRKIAQDVMPFYRFALQERRNAGDVQRFLGGRGEQSVFNQETGRLDMERLQRRLLDLRGPDVQGLAPRNDAAFEQAVSRGAGEFLAVDQPNLVLPIGIFTRSSPLPGFSVRLQRPRFPKFVGTTQRTFAQPRVPIPVTQTGAATVSQRLRSLRESPFGGPSIRPTETETQ